jgi:hypothetical protein
MILTTYEIDVHPHARWFAQIVSGGTYDHRRRRGAGGRAEVRMMDYAALKAKLNDPQFQCLEEGCRKPVEWSFNGPWSMSSLMDPPEGTRPPGKDEGYCQKHNHEHFGYGPVIMAIFRDQILSMMAKHDRDALKWPAVEGYAGWLDD